MSTLVRREPTPGIETKKVVILGNPVGTRITVGFPLEKLADRDLDRNDQRGSSGARARVRRGVSWKLT